MTIKEFREATKDIPEDTEMWQWDELDLEYIPLTLLDNIHLTDLYKWEELSGLRISSWGASPLDKTHPGNKELYRQVDHKKVFIV